MIYESLIIGASILGGCFFILSGLSMKSDKGTKRKLKKHIFDLKKSVGNDKIARMWLERMDALVDNV